MRYVALIALLLPIVANAQEITKPRLTVLDNGLRIVTVEDHKSPLVSVVWSVRAGDSTEPPASAGISHLVEHLVSDRGTVKYPDNTIAALVSGRGGHADAQTSYDLTMYEIVLHSNELDQVLSMHEQMMFWAVFDEKGFQTEKMVVFEELRSDQDQIYEYLWDRAPYYIYPSETFYSRSTNGSIESVKSITLERARQYYRVHYIPNNMTLVVVGDFDTETALAKIAVRFAQYKRQIIKPHSFREMPIKPGATVVTEERDVAKSHFLFAFEGPKMSSPDYLPIDVLMHYVGGDSPTVPLRDTLIQERAILQKLSASPLRRKFGRGWQPFIGEGEPKNIPAGIDSLLEILDQVRARGVSREDLALVKKRLASAHRQAMTNGLKYATALAESDAHGDYRLIAEYEDRIGRVTTKDVWTVARKYFRPERFFLMAVFPRGKTPTKFADDVKRTAGHYAGLPKNGGVSQVLDNGATLLYEPRIESRIDSFTVAVKAGERDDGKQSGLANGTAKMMRRLTKRHSPKQLQAFLDREGIKLSSATDKDGTTFTLSAPLGKTVAVAKLIKEILSEPNFRTQEWEVERRSLIAEATSKLGNPREFAKSELLAQLYHRTAYGARLEDYKSSVEGISRSDLVTFHGKFYRPERIAIAYVGSASLSSVTAAFSGRLGARRASGKPRELVFRPKFSDGVQRSAIPMPGKQQVNLYWSWPAPKMNSDDWIIWLLAQRAFCGDESSRLWRLRQEEGLAYEIRCDSLKFKDRPVVLVYMSFAKDKYRRAVSALEREISNVLKEGISAEELERVKVAFATSLERSNQTAVQRSNMLANAWLKGLEPDRWERLLKVASSATLGSVNRVLRQTLSTERVLKVEVGAVTAE